MGINAKSQPSDDEAQAKKERELKQDWLVSGFYLDMIGNW